MNLDAISDLYYGVAPAAPGFNEDSALDELRRAAIYFARETLISQETLENSVASGERVLSVEPPAAGLEVYRVLWVSAPYGPIRIETAAWLNQVMPAWRTATGDPCACCADADGELALSSAPTRDIDPVYLRVAFLPAPTATKIDRVLAREWGDAIIDFALHRILRMPNQTWSNPGAAQEAYARAAIAAERAKAAAAVARSSADIRSGPRPFFPPRMR